MWLILELLGYELDLNKMSESEQQQVKRQIKFMKKYREVIQFGTFYRLRSPFETNITAWMVVSKDQNIALVGYYRPLQLVNKGYERIQLKGLAPDKLYHVSINECDSYGESLRVNELWIDYF